MRFDKYSYHSGQFTCLDKEAKLLWRYYGNRSNMFVLKIVQMVMLKVGGHDIYSQVPASKRRACKTPRLTDTMFVAGKLHVESIRTLDIDGGGVLQS